jgi:acetolactate synthase-1/2/3 large subunit
MRRLSQALPANAIIVYDTGGSSIMMGHCFKAKWGQTIFSSNGNSPMGFAFCGALGAWFADKTRPIICLIGDGGFNMNIQELQTMMNYGCNVKTFILNNHCYGNTKLWQKANNKAMVACGPDGYIPPNFEAIARAYNVPVVDRIDCFCNLEEKIADLVKQPFACVIDVVHHDFYDYYPRISRFDQPLHEQDPPLAKEEIEANLI